ncbi:hypothetical protein ACS0TY_029599 [Phlomoides rotata]
MQKALRSAIPSPFSYHLPRPTIRKPLNSSGTIRFAQSESGPHQSHQMDPEKQPTHPESETTDTMSSLGEGYATRSDEEGFGGIYGGNQYFPRKTDHQAPTEKFDDSQGSEVKEKEKARHQEKVAP